MFETLAGRPPFNPDSLAELVVSHRDRVPPRVNEVNPAASIPQSLENLLACCLEKDEGHRYQSMADLRADLELVAKGLTPRHIPEKPATATVLRIRRPGRVPILLLAVICVVALMVPMVPMLLHPAPKLDDPYAAFTKEQLLYREQELLTQEDSLHNVQKFAEMEKSMDEADRLKPYLRLDPDLQARIDGKRGALTFQRARDWAAGKEQHDLLLASQPPLERAIAEYDQARWMFGKRHDTHSAKRVQRMLGEEMHDLTYLRESAQMLKQQDTADRAAAKLIQLSASVTLPMEYGESERCQKAYLYLIESSLLSNHPDKAMDWTKRLLEFYKAQDVDQEFAAVKKESILALWAKYFPERRNEIKHHFETVGR